MPTPDPVTTPPAPQVGAVVVGTGFGVITHLRALKLAGIEVRALVGRDAAKAQDCAARFGVPVGTNDLDEALTLDGVDLVAVATPPHTHVEIVMSVIAAGKHVLCEKPFALNVGEARQMLDAADAAGVIHLLGTEWRFATGQAQLNRLIRAGQVGEPRLAVFQLHVPTHVDPAAELPDWWTLEHQGGGWLGAHATHIIDQVRMSMGEITSVSASLQCLVNRPGMTADDTYTVIMHLDTDATVLMHASCAAAGPFLTTRKIIGNGGTAWVEGDQVCSDNGSGLFRHPFPDDLPPVLPVPPPPELLRTAYDAWHAFGSDLAPYARLYRRVHDQILGRRVADDPSLATFVDGLASQAVLDAIRASSASVGERVDVLSI